MTETYATLVAKHAETRHALDSVRHARYKRLKNIFELVFPFAGKHFKTAMDLIYYQGGYPSPNSPPRAEALADSLAGAMYTLDALKREQLFKLLEQRGVRVTLAPNPGLTEPIPSDVRDAIGAEWVEAEMPGTPGRDRIAILRAIADAAHDLQGDICAEADSIKITGAEVAKRAHHIEKPNFMRAVRLGAIQLRRGIEIMQRQRDKAIATADNVDQALAPLPLE